MPHGYQLKRQTTESRAGKRERERENTEHRAEYDSISIFGLACLK